MTSAVDICNQALALVAEQAIMALSDNSQAARLCSVHYGPAVREVLRSANWRCARRRVVLSRIDEPPAFGWAHRYQLPGDFIRAVILNDCAIEAPRCPLFEIEGRALLTNEARVNIVYIYDVTQASDEGSVAVLDPLCTRAVATLLASKLAWPLQQSRSLRESLLSEYEAVKREAKTVNARDAREKVPAQESSWMAARAGE